MTKLYFTEDHEWISVDGDVGTVGITDYAQHALGDIVFAELPALGAAAVKGKEIAVVESVKAASDVYSPVTGEVIAANAAVADQPGLVNEAPEDSGWFFKVRLSNASELDGLMDRDAYDAFVKGLE
ncbi:MAG TPA: glycine cleavage system protein GcvH [Candidatus Sulfotelmatobacter sp.]|jgi:glycine cleavage system H protein|nr:glycine cleavage system protein GcvH [Candidatus Sulfotelmatobacter sp.]